MVTTQPPISASKFRNYRTLWDFLLLIVSYRGQNYHTNNRCV